MLDTQILRLDFSKDAVTEWKLLDVKHDNWPVVYLLDDGRPNPGTPRRIYVGESRHAATRLRQHLEDDEKGGFKNVRVILDERFNKSACQDLESYLIKMSAGDGANKVHNRNNGLTNGDYFHRDLYRDLFPDIFERLKAEGLFTRTIPEIENSDLFRLSPFKSLTEDQGASVEEITRNFLAALVEDTRSESTIVVQGDPGTGKTVMAIYLIKLLVDIQTFTFLEDLDNDSRFANFFTRNNQALLRPIRIGLIVPQVSLRASIEKVFKKTPGLEKIEIMGPLSLGKVNGTFGLLLVDETHRLNQRANQSSPRGNTKFRDNNVDFFGNDDFSKTQLDWVCHKSQHRIFLLDAAQAVLPADLPPELLSRLVNDARALGRHHQLRTQMRVQAGSDFVRYVRWILEPDPLSAPPVPRFGGYDFRIFEDFDRMRREIFQRDSEWGLSRMVAGYAWEWVTKRDKKTKLPRGEFDIEIGETRLRWNSKGKDWVSSHRALEEVGSIHTVQGYDLNYAGVIIGLDLRYDPQKRRLRIDRKSYFDRRGKENNKRLGKTYSDDDLLRFITQIYCVLMTRGIRGTYIYACDPDLREYLKTFIPQS